jgi:hypothetical protein
MWMARFLPVLFVLLFVNGPVPLTGEFDDSSSTDAQAVHQTCTRRIVGGARDLRISRLERPLQRRRQDLRSRTAEALSLPPISEPVCKIPDCTSSFDSPSEED